MVEGPRRRPRRRSRRPMGGGAGAMGCWKRHPRPPRVLTQGRGGGEDEVERVPRLSLHLVRIACRAAAMDAAGRTASCYIRYCASGCPCGLRLAALCGSIVWRVTRDRWSAGHVDHGCAPRRCSKAVRPMPHGKAGGRRTRLMQHGCIACCAYLCPVACAGQPACGRASGSLWRAHTFA